MKKFLSFLLWGLTALIVLVVAVSAGAWYWVTEQPVALQAERIDYLIEPGSSPRQVARTMRQAGIDLNEDAFVYVARLSKLDTQLKAGGYEVVQGDSLWRMLERMASGDVTQRRLTLVEGWTYQRIREALRAHPDVRQTLEDVDDAALRQRLGIVEDSLEGWFYPDTYVFAPGTTDFDILRRAHHAQQTLLNSMWEQRQPDLPLKSPYEAMILASIVEKETGHDADRERVAGVFINRLKRGMLLQTDPTVIYGMGEAYQGRIRKRDLTTDTPWNTYTRAGLPPTPIANSGKAALQATLHPEAHRYLYFVSRGDGTSEFSENLQAHNRAVSRYILNRGQ
ncbi:endolytic transglycosylase MltG [Pusillimonas sp. CC-YST705]|uniref:Endolytic murein transglycosylase n=1 Tax=Mesopusillimonas faecipullorum TaxID=2755040 RepID=A0ABS8CB66_9BURK|nr:endolytic transglycosylase MltG [Mesopusillimonas faecipullorum]MCB5363094.1 endolytic transglycosylase MltG [Mesopusillimonas faecipullorum]